MKAAIVGSSGYISGYLLKKFENVLKIDQTPEADVHLGYGMAIISDEILVSYKK